MVPSTSIDPISKEARFLAKLEGSGFRPNPGDTDRDIGEIGNDICRGLSNGHGVDTLVPMLAERGYGDQRSGNLLGAALPSCPEYQGSVLHDR